MKEFFSIKDTTGNKITFFHLAFFLAMLPFDRIYSELALISLLIHTLIHIKPGNISIARLRNAMVPATIYLVICAGTAYSHYTDRAFFEWEILLALLLFPFIFSVTTFNCQRYTVPLLFALGISCVCTVIYLYVSAFADISYNHLPPSSIFTGAFINHNFSQPIDLHATYFSMYIALCIPLFIHLWMRNRNVWIRFINTFCIVVLLAGVLQLASRSVLIAVVLISCFVIPFLQLQKKQRRPFIITAVIISFIMALLIMNNDTFRSRYITGFRSDLSAGSANGNMLEPRWVRWQCAFELIKTAPLFGHGSGSEIPLLKELYFKKGYYQSYTNELNAHNQYLGILIETGILGLCVFLWVLYKGFSAAIKTRNAFFFSFLLIITMVGFSENILSVNKTIFFFAFFFSFFLQPAINVQEKKVTQK